MRSRNIKPGILRNEFFGTQDPIYTILFQGLWMMADRQGRLEDRPLLIKADIFPYRENIDINGGLTVIQREGFIRRYEVDGKRYIQVVNFSEHQSPHKTEKQSVIPPEDALKSAVTADNGEPTVNPPLINGTETVDILPDSLILRFTDSLNQEEERATQNAGASENDLYLRLQKIINAPYPVSMQRIGAWLAGGANEELIVETISCVMAKRGGRSPPTTLNYFENAIAEAIAAKTAPMEIENARNRLASPTTKSQLDRAIEATERARAARERGSTIGA